MNSATRESRPPQAVCLIFFLTPVPLPGAPAQVALALTERENHRTETEFEDALISKTFSFQFINRWTPLAHCRLFCFLQMRFQCVVSQAKTDLRSASLLDPTPVRGGTLRLALP